MDTSRDVSYGLTTGKLDIDNSALWGIEMDVIVRPGVQAALVYQRQDSKAVYKSPGEPDESTDLSVEYFQVGGIAGMQQGKIMPFTMGTLGATRYNFKEFNDDQWKFSIILGLGAKVYASERVGIRVQGTLPFTFISGGGTIGCGGGSCWTAVGGTGVTQWTLSAGLIVML